MIFELTASTADLEQSNRPLLSSVVSEILRAHRLGHHLLIVKKDIASWLLSNLDLGSRDLAMLERIRSDFTQTGSLRSTTKFKILVDVSHMSKPVLKGNSVVIGLRDANRPYITDQTILLVENNYSDGEFYKKILNELAFQVSATQISVDIHHGGGETITKVWEQRIGEYRLVCMVADSDKKHPRQKVTSKIDAANQFARQNDWPLGQAIALPCREIENLVPLRLISSLECAQGKAAVFATLERIERGEIEAGVSELDKFKYFFDLKLGIDKEDLENISSTDEGMWISSKLKLAGNQFHTPGFGQKIIPLLLDNDKYLADFMKHVRSSNWWLTFRETFEFVLWMGFAPARQIV